MTLQETIARTLEAQGFAPRKVTVDRDVFLYGVPATAVTVRRMRASVLVDETITLAKSNKVDAEHFSAIVASYLK